MRCYSGLYVIYIFIIGLTGTSSEGDNEICGSQQLDNQCSSYALNIVNHMMNFISQLQQENVDYKQKDKKRNELIEETLELQQKVAKNVEKDQLIELYKATADSNAERIKELQETNNFYKQLIEQKPKNVVSAQNDAEQLRTILTEVFKNQFQKVGDTLDQFKGQSEEFNKLRDKFEIELKKKDKIINENKETILKLRTELEHKNSELKKIESDLSEEERLSVKLKATLGEKDNIITELRRDVENKTNELTQTVAHYNESVQQQVKEISEKKRNSSDILSPIYCTSFASGTGTLQIEVAGMAPFKVLCDAQTAGRGWITIQQRINGDEDFQRDWATYRKGFGSFDGDFFLGLENIHRLTSTRRYELYIFMERFSGVTNYARYDNFRINGESDQYRLVSLGYFSGNVANNLEKHLNRQFSTIDRDNDIWSGNCAESYHGGWWYNACADCLLNGKYHPSEVNQYRSNWWDFAYSLKTIKMLIRPKECQLIRNILYSEYSYIC